MTYTLGISGMGWDGMRVIVGENGVLMVFEVVGCFLGQMFIDIFLSLLCQVCLSDEVDEIEVLIECPRE